MDKLLFCRHITKTDYNFLRAEISSLQEYSYYREKKSIRVIFNSFPLVSSKHSCKQLYATVVFFFVWKEDRYVDPFRIRNRYDHVLILSKIYTVRLFEDAVVDTYFRSRRLVHFF